MYKVRLFNPIRDPGWAADSYKVGVLVSTTRYRITSLREKMAVIRFKGSNIDNFHLCYDTPIIDDVLDHLSKEDV